MNKKNGTYLVEFSDGGRIIFGNNYKSWWQHAVEYTYHYCGDRDAIQAYGWQYKYITDVVKNVLYSNQQFYDDGGLKWCDVDVYQGVINDAVQRDKLAPVKVEDIIFERSSTDKATLTKKLKEY